MLTDPGVECFLESRRFTERHGKSVIHFILHKETII